MKTLLSAFLFAAVAASPALAKNGQGGGAPIVARGSQAWFVLEASEHALRGLFAADAEAAAGLTSLETSTDGDVATVTLGTAGEVVTFSCVMFDDVSKSGTVVKKEVACQRL